MAGRCPEFVSYIPGGGIMDSTGQIMPDRLPRLSRRVAYIHNTAGGLSTRTVFSFSNAERLSDPSTAINEIIINGQQRNRFPPQKLNSWSEEGPPWDFATNRILLSRVNECETINCYVNMTVEDVSGDNDDNGEDRVLETRLIYIDSNNNNILTTLHSSQFIVNSIVVNPVQFHIHFTKPMGTIYENATVKPEFIFVNNSRETSLNLLRVRFTIRELLIIGDPVYVT